MYEITKKNDVIFYKLNRRIKCYVKQEKNGWRLYSGKPSDATCFSWFYITEKEACESAKRYMQSLIELRQMLVS